MIINNFYKVNILLFIVFSSPPCYLASKGSHGVISSDSAKNHLSCRWLITVPANHKVRLNFTQFLLDSFRNETHIQIFSGKDESNPLLGTFTGSSGHFTVEANGNIMMIKLTKGRNNSLCVFKGVFSSIKSKGER